MSPAVRRSSDLPEEAPPPRRWPQDVSHEPLMKIGEVVERLKPSFPALSLSKIRYLESEGLIRPHRVGNGYRQYSQADLERLRFTLTAQRDEYLPLSVIRERLRRLDCAAGSPPRPVARVVASHGRLVEGGPVGLKELMARSGATEAQVDELISIGLITPDARGQFDSRCQRALALALKVHELGLPLRNLRLVRSAAERQADVVDQAVAHRRRRSASAGEEAASEMAGLVTELYSLLLHRSVGSLH